MSENLEFTELDFYKMLKESVARVHKIDTEAMKTYVYYKGHLYDAIFSLETKKFTLVKV